MLPDPDAVRIVDRIRYRARVGANRNLGETLYAEKPV